LDPESDYRILAEELSRLRNNDVSGFERVYVRFRKEWLNIIKEGYEGKFYDRLTGKVSQLWKSIHIFYMNKPKSSHQRYSRMRKKISSMLTKRKSRPDTISRLKKGKSKPWWSTNGLLDQLEQVHTK